MRLLFTESFFALSQPVIILGIESSCDETAAAVSIGDKILANIVASQKVHESYGGIVPELASRAHQQNIIPVVDQALKQANVRKNDLSAVAFTSGPGLMGALLVGTSFAKSLALGLGIPLIEVNHMQAHVLAHFARRKGVPEAVPSFPFLCLTVSGGHTQIILVKSHFEMELMGQTLDDAAGEAFDKIAKIMGLTYPGGPLIDQLAQTGNPVAFRFPHPQVGGYDFSFSGLKTSVINFINNRLQSDPHFVETHLQDLAASIQHTIIEILMQRLRKAVADTGITTVAIAGGVAANSGLRRALKSESGWSVFIPPFDFCTDNAAMIAVCGYFKYLQGDFADQMTSPEARFSGL